MKHDGGDSWKVMRERERERKVFEGFMNCDELVS